MSSVSTKLRSSLSRAIFLPAFRFARIRVRERCLAYAASYTFPLRFFCSSYQSALFTRWNVSAISWREYPRAERISISLRSALVIRAHFFFSCLHSSAIVQISKTSCLRSQRERKRSYIGVSSEIVFFDVRRRNAAFLERLFDCLYHGGRTRNVKERF